VALRALKDAEKIFARFMPRNPLISLDSDERIQGNPRNLKAYRRLLSQRNSGEARKPKQAGWAKALRGREINILAPFHTAVQKTPELSLRGLSVSTDRVAIRSNG
jgi:hypothetical protein